MKIIKCLECEEVYSIHPPKPEKDPVMVRCSCGCTAGAFVNGFEAVYAGPGLPLVLENKSLAIASQSMAKRGRGLSVLCFVPSEDQATFRKIEMKELESFGLDQMQASYSPATSS